MLRYADEAECRRRRGRRYQHDGSARDPRHDSEAATCALQRARRCTMSIRLRPSCCTPSPPRTTSCPRSTQRWRSSAPTSHRRLSAHHDFSAVYCRRRPTPAPAVLPSTTFTTSCVRSAAHAMMFPIGGALLSSPRAPPASTTLRAGHILHTTATPAAATPHRPRRIAGAHTKCSECVLSPTPPSAPHFGLQRTANMTGSGCPSIAAACVSILSPTLHCCI
ncbi:hypothetical protein B0H19DRAFT_1277378 [Mycena capillaripes]|nr:hypothetical protein B0H19DRAFT_1277378 [Mycena capillaripes]